MYPLAVHPDRDSSVRVAHLMAPCSVLGPGRRAVVWVQGCSLECAGCIAGPILDPRGGAVWSVRDLAGRILDFPDIEGLTLSGGEPFEQAGALARLVESIRAVRDLSLMVYSGRTIEALCQSRDVGVSRLLAAADILVDGPFIELLACDRLWRGSTNQRVHMLTGRHRDRTPRLEERGAGIEVTLTLEGGLFWAGVPPPGFASRLAQDLLGHGVRLSVAK